MFYHHADIGPVRPLTARETLEKFGGQWLRRPGPELRPQRPDIDEPRQQKDQPEARRTEARGDDQQTPTADTQRRAQERQQQANESDRSEGDPEKQPRTGPHRQPWWRAKPRANAMSRAGQRQPQHGGKNSLSACRRPARTGQTLLRPGDLPRATSSASAPAAVSHRAAETRR